MNVNELVEKYKVIVNRESKESFIDKSIKFKKYVSYPEKIVEASKIVNATCYDPIINKDEDGNVVSVERGSIKISSPIRYAMSIHTLIRLYTNIEVDEKNFISEFDSMNEYELIEEIIARIPEKEVAEFNTIVSMTFDDFIKNKYEAHNFCIDLVDMIANFLSNKFDAIIPMISEFGNRIDNMSDDEKEKMKRNVGKIFDKITK